MKNPFAERSETHMTSHRCMHFRLILRLGSNFQRAIFLTMFLFGLLTWLYVVAVQVTHPEWVATPLTHIDVFPLNVRVDSTGITGFLVSALGFLLWRLTSKNGRC